MNANDATVARLEQALGIVPTPRTWLTHTTVPHEVTERMVQAFANAAMPGSWESLTEPQRQVCRENFQLVWDAVLEVCA